MVTTETEIELIVEPASAEILNSVRERMHQLSVAVDQLDCPDDRLQTVLSYGTWPIHQGHAQIQALGLFDANYNQLEGFSFNWSDICIWDPAGPELTLKRMPISDKPPKEPSVRWTPLEGMVPWDGQPAASGQPVPDQFASDAKQRSRILPTGTDGMAWRSHLRGPDASVLELITWPDRQTLKRLELSPWAPEPHFKPIVALPLPQERALLLFWHDGGLCSAPRVRDRARLCFVVRAWRRGEKA